VDEISVVILYRTVIINERQLKTLPLIDLLVRYNSIRILRRVNMELTIQEVHTYNDLINKGEAEPLDLPGCDTSEFGGLVIPRLDEDDRVYFHDLASGVNVYPGINTIEKIKKAIDKIK
jgi:hypothetical protein